MIGVDPTYLGSTLVEFGINQGKGQSSGRGDLQDSGASTTSQMTPEAASSLQEGVRKTTPGWDRHVMTAIFVEFVCRSSGLGHGHDMFVSGAYPEGWPQNLSFDRSQHR